jgi:peptidoglycan-associated lipoprotein
MKPFLLAVVGVVAVLAASSCSKKSVVASHPANTAPVAQTSAPPAPVRAASRPASTPTQQRAAATQAAARSNQMPAQVRKTLNDSLARMEDALFDYDKSTIRTDATTALKDDAGIIRGILADYPSQKLIIQGNTDERGSDEYNMALGDRRARAAQEFLVTMGVSANQLEVISFGKDHPVCTDQTEACWQKNRRAHLTAAP